MNPNETPEVVVITGASAGVGRAPPRLRTAGRAHRPAGAGRAGLEAPGGRGAAGGKALVLPTDTSDPIRWKRRRRRSRREFGPIDIWVNDAMCSVFSPVKDMTPADYRRVTEVTYLGYVHGTLAALKRMLPRDRGDHRPGRVRPGLPRHSAAIGLLRGQARHPGLLRLAAIRIDPRPQQRPAHDGADARSEYAAVRLGQEPPAAQGAAGAAHLSARGRRRGHLLRRAPLPARMVLGGSTCVAIVGNKIAPGLGDWYLGQQGYDAQQYDGKETRTSRTTSTRRSMRTWTTAPTATSTTGRTTAAFRSGRTRAATGSSSPARRVALRRLQQRPGQGLARRVGGPCCSGRSPPWDWPLWPTTRVRAPCRLRNAPPTRSAATAGRASKSEGSPSKGRGPILSGTNGPH